MTQMKYRFLFLFLAAAAAFFMASCAVTSHPNEKLIVGKWRPVTVEKVVDSSVLQAEATLKGDAGTQKSKTPGKTGAGGNRGGVDRREANLDRLVKTEMRSNLEIFPDKTAIKSFPGEPIRATWKMKGKGTRIVAKNIENKMKFTIDILEISKERILVIEHAPVGDVKILYERVME